MKRIHEADPAFTTYRPNVGIIVLNDQKQVFVAQRIDSSKDAWQMPQGGIDDGEEVWGAALRELEEETSITSVQRIGVIPKGDEWLCYDLPHTLQGTLWGGPFIGQRQKWVVVAFAGDEEDIDLETTHPEFSAWKWVDIKKLPALAVSFKKDLYVHLSRSLESEI